MSFICTDQGASNTRFIINNNKASIIPNNMVFVEEDADIRLTPNSEDIEDCLDLTIVKTEGKSDYFPKRVLMGSLAERYSSSNIRPSMMANKSRQPVNYVSILAACAIAQYEQGVNDSIKLFINLPPLEISENEDFVKEQLIGKFEVKFNKKDGVTMPITIDYLKICPESVMAVFSFFFTQDGQPRAEMNDYCRGYVLSLDIGASTSDLVLVKDRKYVDRTGYTYKIGGNSIAEMMRAKVRSLHGSELTDDDVNTLVAEGRLPFGNTYKDMSKELILAKREFANMLFEKMNTYFGTVNISLQSIKAIFVSGGGSMKSTYTDPSTGKVVVTSESTSHYITEVIKDYCDGIEVIEYPEENPRMSNIIGTAMTANIIRSKMEEASKVKK